MPASTRQKRGLQAYTAKRNFALTPEPRGQEEQGASPALNFVIQKHWASRLHYDFRLELDGVTLSWAVPRGPSYDPAMKSMAIQVEDHPLGYNSFEGTIPAKQYGAGEVIIWDRGTWEPMGDPREGLEVGKILFRLHGEKLAGLWELVRISKPGEKKQDQWMLFKKKGDAWARSSTDYDVVTALPDSVVAHPLGLVEEREPRAPPPRKDEAPDLANALPIKKLPKSFAPQLARLTEQVPSGDWIAENKFDGYRLLARIEQGRCSLFTRNGHDWTDKLQSLANAVDAMGLVDAWIDGEIVVVDTQGVPSFNALQNAIDSAKSESITYFVFDLPYVGDTDLRAVPLRSRRLVLKALLKERGSDRVRFSEALDAEPSQLLGAACRLGLEGLILKDPRASYVSERSDTWLKLKCQKRQEFVVVGYTVRGGTTNAVGGLLLAVHEGEALRYVGNVGTGFDAATARDLHDRLRVLETDTPAVERSSVKPGRWSRRSAGSERWVRPKMVVEVAFAEWTPERHVRHAIFKGVRADKPPQDIGIEQAVKKRAEPRKAKLVAPVVVTHPDRVIDPSTGLRKVDLVRYYESVAEWMLPHLAHRPVSLVRAPQGVTGQLFFQKHPETRVPGLGQLDPDLWPGHAALLVVDSAKALVAAAQMNTVEFHTWNSTARKIDQPDRIVFDLDPGEGVSWGELQEAALLTRTLLHELGLDAWLKTSGGKGLHVVVPVRPRLAFDAVKQFSRDVVAHMARVIPQRFVAKSGPSNRKGRIFIDYLRNGHGQTTAAAFSARSRPGTGVSMPIAWEQLGEVKSGAQWTVLTTREYLSFQKSDPWAAYWTRWQSLAQAVKTLAAARRDG